jgi:hypothetical protein
MGCDYYIQTELVIEYIDDKGAMSKTITNRVQEKCYVYYVPDEDSDDDQETQDKKFQDELQRKIIENTYKKTLYENDAWIKSSYEKRYVKDLNMICPGMVKLVKIYKDYTAWKRE